MAAPAEKDLAAVVDDFKSVADDKGRLKLLLDYARQLPAFPEEQRTYANRVMGCTAQVGCNKFTIVRISECLTVL